MAPMEVLTELAVIKACCKLVLIPGQEEPQGIMHMPFSVQFRLDP